MCEQPLPGNILQVNMITSLSRECASRDENCKSKMLEMLKHNLSEVFTASINPQLVDSQLMNIDLKLCNITEKPGMKIMINRTIFHLNF